MNRKNIDMAYMAGIMDGDGSFSIIKLKTNASPLYYPFLQLVNRREEMIDFCKKNFGGSVHLPAKHICKDGSEGNQVYRWRLRGIEHVGPVLENIIPFLKIKRDRAEFLRDFIANFKFKRGYRLSHDDLAARERDYLKMVNFNDWTSFDNTISTKLAKQASSDVIFWSYLAGLMDTDGSFSVKKQVVNKGTDVKNPRYLPVISLSMTDTRAINYIRENFPFGKLYIPKNKSCKNGFHYQFGIYTKAPCAEFLTHIIPYLRDKQENAKILLEFCLKSQNAKFCKAGISEEELAFRESCYQKLIYANKYGLSKSSLIVLEPLPDNAGGNKEQAGQKLCSLNAVSGMTSKEDAVL
jgi:hypothetical protein